ncbi:hypothetical protein [Pseudomonas huanghezhanensis]|uniref:hypothetical protein n=1 Tax=Pseudomonas huanghezhanensis TaxID=3002903 RepID=UPI00228618A7|nr:hypothetical protein [Pseudomonas sp. BSw22131]
MTSLPPDNCRQQLAADGKAYPKSNCAVCGQFSPRWKECDALLAAGPAQHPVPVDESCYGMVAPVPPAGDVVDEPVLWFKWLPGVLAKSNGQCYDVMFSEVDGYTPLYRRAKRKLSMPGQLFPVTPVLPHPPRHTGFFLPDREVPGYTLEQMKEYGAMCVAAFARQIGEQS